MSNELVKVINESGLEGTKAQVLLEQFSNYFEIAADWENKAKALTVTNIEQKAEMKMARAGRLFLKEKRVSVEKTRKALKENALREGQTIDAIAKILTNLIVPIEKDLEDKEKFAEIQEAKRIALLLEERQKEVSDYLEFIPYGIDLGKLDSLSYTNLLMGAKLQKQAKIDAEIIAEQERIAKEKAEEEERERIRVENARLKAEAEERAKELEIERAKARAEAEAKEKELAIERQKADAEKAKLLAELKAKEQAELKAKAEQDAKLKAEAEALKKAKAAPDKVKLLNFADTLGALAYPDVQSDEAKAILAEVSNKLNDACNFLKLKCSTM